AQRQVARRTAGGVARGSELDVAASVDARIAATGQLGPFEAGISAGTDVQRTTGCDVGGARGGGLLLGRLAVEAGLEVATIGADLDFGVERLTAARATAGIARRLDIQRASLDIDVLASLEAGADQRGLLGGDRR